jgi:uncharacterized ParB-like nuclease family protein
MSRLLEGYGRKKRRARVKLAARTVLRMMVSGTIDADDVERHR